MSASPTVAAPACLDIRDLRMHFGQTGGFFKQKTGTVKAVDGIDLTIADGETVGLVGESGCGKSTLGRTLLRVCRPTSGEIWYRPRNSTERVDLAAADAQTLSTVRSQIRMIFQDPYTSLNAGRLFCNPSPSRCCCVGWPTPMSAIASRRSCARWGCVQNTCRAIRTRSPAVNASASSLLGACRRAARGCCRRGSIGTGCLGPRPGENLFSMQDARNLVRHAGMRPDRDWLQFDCALSYGLVEYLRTLDMLREHGWSPRRCIPHGGHQLSLNIAAGLGLGGNESYPDVFGPFGGFADGYAVSNSYVALPDVPGIGFEAKADLITILRQC
jgi:ABC-type oligopeptide transport system ATPase subunit